MPLAQIGRKITHRLIRFGEFSIFSCRALIGIPCSIPTWARWRRIMPLLYRVGSTSTPVLALTGLFIGAVLALESWSAFASIGQENRLGGVINLSVVKQIGPVLAGVMLAGRIGCSLTAELGSMKVTEQLDAMTVMAADPVKVLVTPRVVACVVMIPILVVVSNGFGMVGGWFVATQVYPANPSQYWKFSADWVTWFDVINGLIKSVFFGLAIGLISCWKGFSSKAGASGVGDATTDGFVTSFIAIIVLNFALAKLLNDIDQAFIAA